MNLEAQMDSAMRHMKKQMSEIPRGVIANARGLVFLTMIKGALIWSGSLSTGIVVKRLTRNSWSPPVSVGMASVGFGLQAGGEKVEIIIVIGDDEEIEAFAGTGQLKLGVSYGLAAGPVGRDLDISAYMGSGGLSCSMYYAYSKGAYIGFSLEGAVLLSRWTTNKSFYGEKVKVKDVLNGKVAIPANKQTLIENFHTFLLDFEMGRLDNRIFLGASSTAAPPKKASSQSLVPSMTKSEEEELLIQFDDLGITGKQLLSSTLQQTSVPAAPQLTSGRVVFTDNHIVDENDPSYKAYGIISASKGETATLIDGTLVDGLSAPYSDYVRVTLQKGSLQKTGLVSKYVLKPL